MATNAKKFEPKFVDDDEYGKYFKFLKFYLFHLIFF